MKNKIHFLMLGLLVFLFFACNTSPSKYEAGVGEIATVVNEMTSIMVKDVANPPLAARFFAYVMLAGYEVSSHHDSTLASLYGKLNEYPKIPKPAIENYNWQLAAVLAMYETAASMQPSGKILGEKVLALMDSCNRSGISEITIQNSLQYAKTIAGAILTYAKEDGYRKISNYPRYAPKEGPGYWYPTPPGFFPAVEPYFHKVRPFTLTAANQFVPAPPVEYTENKKSPFYKLTNDVYIASKSLSTEQKTIAAFWDCNPFALQDEGHLQIGVKKISPGAHWMGITSIACSNLDLNFSRSMEIHTIVAITLMDAFMCCWDEKYRSHRIRPETVIRQLIDPSWRPVLQTPPFPEYLSGHSVISTAAATVLTHYLGDDVDFIDTVEIPYGLAPRQFSSFKVAAEEAAISRFYGGIHFMDAITIGQEQGNLVGQEVIKRLNQPSIFAHP